MLPPLLVCFVRAGLGVQASGDGHVQAHTARQQSRAGQACTALLATGTRSPASPRCSGPAVIASASSPPRAGLSETPSLDMSNTSIQGVIAEAACLGKSLFVVFVRSSDGSIFLFNNFLTYVVSAQAVVQQEYENKSSQGKVAW